MIKLVSQIRMCTPLTYYNHCSPRKSAFENVGLM